MKVYIAAPYPAREYVLSLFPALAESGHECTSTWATGTRDIKEDTVGPSLATEHEDLVRHVKGDLYDVARSGALIALTAGFVSREMGLGSVPERWLHTGGRHVELGYALGMYYPVIVVGEPENVFQRGLCTIVPDFTGAIQALTS